MGRIVVGVDGSAGSRRALEWAMDEARHRQAAVEVVMAWEDPYEGTSIVPTSWTANAEAIEKTRRAELDAILDSTDAEGLPAPVETILSRGQAARTLLDVAQGADLLVVGTRGRGGFAGLLLGSVSHQLAGHAPCPVVVVPASDHGQA